MRTIMPSPDPAAPVEIEVTLAVCAEDPGQVLARIATLTRVGPFSLRPRDTLAIRDIYLDTPAGDLCTRGLGLRVREIAPDRWLTLKGPSRTSRPGYAERLEIEAPWSLAALKRIAGELEPLGIAIPAPPEESARAEPREVLQACGLKVIQDRRARRVLRDAAMPGPGGAKVLAELAMDSVTYRFGEHEVCLHEVEVELKAGGNQAVIDQAVEGLTATFGPDLRPWSPSKLSTGLALEALAGKGSLADLLDAENNLRPKGYDVIQEMLKGRD